MDFKTISRKVAGMGGQVTLNVGADQVSLSGAVLSEFAPDLVRVLRPDGVLLASGFERNEVEGVRAAGRRRPRFPLRGSSCTISRPRILPKTQKRMATFSRPFFLISSQ